MIGDRYWFAPVPASRLAATRIMVGAFTCIYLLGRLPHLLSYAHQSKGMFQPVGVISLLDAPLPPLLWQILVFACLGLSLAFTFGVQFRVVGPVFALLLLWVISYRNSWRMPFHTENLMVLHVLILGVAPAADVWAIGKRGQREREDGRYGWALKLMAWVVVATYVLAGVAKLKAGGFEWMAGDVLRNHVAVDNARKLLLGGAYSPLAAPLLSFEPFFAILATVSLVVEVGAPIALLGRRPAALWVLLAIGFHYGVLILMAIVFPYQMAGVAYAPFIRGERWLLKARSIASGILARSRR